jgi:hypothetical protein
LRTFDYWEILETSLRMPDHWGILEAGLVPCFCEGMGSFEGMIKHLFLFEETIRHLPSQVALLADPPEFSPECRTLLPCQPCSAMSACYLLTCVFSPNAHEHGSVS